MPHWEAEARRFRGEAIDSYTPSMRQRIDLDKIYRQAQRGLPTTMDGVPPLPVPATCPVTLAEMLREDTD